MDFVRATDPDRVPDGLGLAFPVMGRGIIAPGGCWRPSCFLGRLVARLRPSRPSPRQQHCGYDVGHAGRCGVRLQLEAFRHGLSRR